MYKTISMQITFENYAIAQLLAVDDFVTLN